MKKKTALITGASRGIGLAIARRLDKDGVRTLTPTRDEMDLRSDASIDAYLARLKISIDIMVNNAGINLLAGGLEVTDENMAETMQVNMVAPLRLVRAVAPRMIAQRYGRIVNISSVWGLVTKPKRITYAMSKAGLLAMTRTLAVELAPYNILVNAVAPGYVNTELTKHNNTAKELMRIRKNIPLLRLAEPAEIAEVVAFLVSARNTYLTGQTIVLDGGFTCL